jgi:hypothetical protein
VEAAPADLGKGSNQVKGDGVNESGSARARIKCGHQTDGEGDDHKCKGGV